MISLTLPLTKIVDHSAETSHTVMVQISYRLLIMAVLYSAALADADFVGRQRRTLFSLALFKKFRT